MQDAVGGLRAKGWTYAAIAAHLDVSLRTVVSWQTGERYPSAVKMVLVALDALTRQPVPARRRSRAQA